MQHKRIPLFVLSLVSVCLLQRGAEGQTVITVAPESTTAALGTNATFSCNGTQRIIWQINGTQIRDAEQVLLFASVQIYASLPRYVSSELIMTASLRHNATTTIVCIVEEGAVGGLVRSDPATVLVYAQPNPPTDINVVANGTDLVATWGEPFSLEGEELSYVVTVMTRNSGILERDVTVQTTSYVLSDPLAERDCSEYTFTVFSQNNFSKSRNAITGRANIPTEPLLMRSSDVDIQVALTNGVSAIIDFNPRDPCPSYPVTSYNFTILENDTGTFVTSRVHTSNVSLVVNSGDGLVTNQVYVLTIEAENSAGSTLSEDIKLYTTGLQASNARMQLDGSISVTCTFATGASSTGCQIRILMDDREIFSKDITRPHGALQATDDVFVQGLSETSLVVVRAAELLPGGRVSQLLFEQTVMVAALPTTTPATSSPVTLQETPATPFGNTLYFIIGAVGGAIVILLLLIILSICVICALQRKKSNKNRYFSNSEELKDNYSYGSSAMLADNGVHARCNTYDNREDQPQNTQIPLYETINNNKMHMGNGASAQPVPNPVYGGEVVHSGSKTASNPVYAEASGQEQHRAMLLSQTSHTTDVSALNPVYSGSAVPLSPLTMSGSFTLVNQQAQSVVPQPSLGAGGVGRYETKLVPFVQYASPSDLANDRYTAVPGSSGQSPYALPNNSPILPPKGGGATAGAEGQGSEYTNTPTHAVPTNPETGYSTLSRGDVVEAPPGPPPIYETIKVKDTRPPVRPDGDGVTLQCNKSYGLLMTDTQSTTSKETTPTSTVTIETTAPPLSPRGVPVSNSPPPVSSPPLDPTSPAPSPNDTDS